VFGLGGRESRSVSSLAPVRAREGARSSRGSLLAASPHLHVERRGDAVVLTLDRPERRNALDAGLVAALGSAVERADADPSVRVLDFRPIGPRWAARRRATGAAIGPWAEPTGEATS